MTGRSGNEIHFYAYTGHGAYDISIPPIHQPSQPIPVMLPSAYTVLLRQNCPLRRRPVGRLNALAASFVDEPLGTNWIPARRRINSLPLECWVSPIPVPLTKLGPVGAGTLLDGQVPTAVSVSDGKIASNSGNSVPALVTCVVARPLLNLGALAVVVVDHIHAEVAPSAHDGGSFENQINVGGCRPASPGWQKTVGRKVFVGKLVAVASWTKAVIDEGLNKADCGGHLVLELVVDLVLAQLVICSERVPAVDGGFEVELGVVGEDVVDYVAVHRVAGVDSNGQSDTDDGGIVLVGLAGASFDRPWNAAVLLRVKLNGPSSADFVRAGEGIQLAVYLADDKRGIELGGEVNDNVGLVSSADSKWVGV